MSRCSLPHAICAALVLGAGACEFPRPADVDPTGDGGGDDDGDGGDGAVASELGPFQTVAGVTLNTARSFHAHGRIGDNLFLFGGVSDVTLPRSIEQAAITDSQDALADFTLASTMLDEGLTQPGVAVSAPFVYVLGGQDDSGNTTRSMERGDIVGPSGLAGMGALIFTLSVKRTAEGLVLTSAFAYICGGVEIVPGSTTKLGSCERTTLGTDGSLGNFNSVASPSLVNARTQFATVVIGDFVYVIGGGTDATFGDRSVERGRIDTDGRLADFEVVSSQLVTGRESHGAVVLDGALYVIGGRDAGLDALDSVERAPILGDGSIGAFATLQTKLATPRYGHSVHVIGRSIFAVGGQADVTGQLGSVERAQLQ